MKCRNCGTEFTEGIFCPECGSRIEKETAVLDSERNIVDNVKEEHAENETSNCEEDAQRGKKEEENKRVKKINRKAILSLILSIVSWISFITVVIPVVCGIWSIVDGAKALKGKTKYKKCAIIGIVLSFLMFALLIWIVLQPSSSGDSIQEASEIDLSGEIAESVDAQQDGVADGYKMMSIQAPTNQIISDYHEKGYGAVWLTSHEVKKNDGEIGEIGTTDSVYMLVTYFDPNGYYQVTEEVGAVYAWWGEEIGWKNTYDVGTLVSCDTTGFNGTRWKLLSDKELDREDYNYEMAASLIGRDIMSQYDIHSKINIYFAFENFDILNAGIEEEAIYFNNIYLNSKSEVGTVNVVVDGNVYSIPLRLKGGTRSNLLIAKGVSFYFNCTERYDECHVYYLTNDSNIMPISTGEYETALQGLVQKTPISDVDVRESVDMPDVDEWESVDMSDVDEWESVDMPDVDVQENDSLDFVFPYSDRMYLDVSDLQGLSAEECRIARNEIYARRGRIFQDADLQTFFEQFDWYEGLYTADEFDESLLNEYEKANRDLIAEYESEMGF